MDSHGAGVVHVHAPAESTPMLEQGQDQDRAARAVQVPQLVQRWAGRRRGACQIASALFAALLAFAALAVLLHHRVALQPTASPLADGLVGFSAQPKAAAPELTGAARGAEAAQRQGRRNLGYDELRLPTVREEVAEQFHPALCVGQSMQAALTLAGLSIKVAGAARECNAWFYRPPWADRLNAQGKVVAVDNGIPAITDRHRRLKDKRHPLLRIEESLRKPLQKLPATPGSEGMRSRVENPSKAWELIYGDFKKTGETAYNVTEGDLSLDNMSFTLGQEWTLEGWHLFQSRGGVMWDTREHLANSTKSGVAVIFTKTGSLAVLIAPDAGAPIVRSCPDPVSMNKWVHVACQRRASSLEFYLNGTQVCTMPAPAELDHLAPQTTVRLGRAADNDPESSLAALVSNMRLSAAALYHQPFAPPRRLERQAETKFLLRGGYLDEVSSRPLLIAGHGLMEGVVNRGQQPPDRKLQLEIFPDQDRLLPGGLPEKIGVAGKRPGFCARSILTIIKDAGTIASNIENNLHLCGNATLVGHECALSVTRSVRAAANAAKYMAEMPVRGCNQAWFSGYFRCADRLEGAAWALDALGTELGDSVESCGDLDLKFRHIKTKTSNSDADDINWGACAGEVASSAGYASTAGMYVGSAAGFDCFSALSLSDKKQDITESLQPWKFPRGYTPLQQAEDLCAQEGTAFVRTLFLSGTKAVRAGGSCAGTDTVCGQNILLSMAAFAGIGQVGATLHDVCLPLESCCSYDWDTADYVCDCGATERQAAWSTSRQRAGKCARYSGSTAKLIGAAVAYAAESVQACETTEDVPAACTAMVTFMIASLGYFAENAGRSYYECPFYMHQNLYQCGQDQSKIATAVERLAAATAAAVINCGALAGAATAATRLVGEVHPPRRFFIV